jgi:hypothetical protein
MAISLRRSRRATKKGVSDYNVGDIVEVSDFDFGSFDNRFRLSIFPSSRQKQLEYDHDTGTPRFIL